jgi:peptidoglycan/xylan/chitin deacetylase (PgdA/CDA1 family)
MAFVKKRGYQVLSLNDYCQILSKNEKIPRNLVVLTFDDGYKDNLEAIEILKKFDFPATIFLIPDKIDTPGYLSREDINWFLNNTKVRVGSHTLTHFYLPEADSATLKKEIRDSKKLLESMFFIEVNTIAYPIGGFNERVLREVEGAGYLCGCTTNRGFSSRLNIFALRRIKLTERDIGIRLWAKLSGFYNVFKRVKRPY